MAKKTQTKGKVVKKTPTKANTKPKGSIVKASNVEDVVPTLAEEAKAAAKNSKNVSKTDDLVDESKIEKALNELNKFVSKSNEESESKDGKTQLFDDELSDNLQLIFTKKDLFSTKKNFKPKLIKVDNKPKSEEEPKVILFIRDGIVDSKILDQIESSELNNILTKIIAGSELKTTYKQYEKRRELFSNNDIFLADDSLITSLPKLLGKTFYESNKIPIPIKISKDNFSIKATFNHIQKVLNSIVYHIPRSNNLSINLGSIESINKSLISQVIQHFKDEELRSIFIKTNQSPALPLYEVSEVYTEEDLEQNQKSNDKVIKSNNEAIEGLPENIKLSEFEKGLLELANPKEVPQIFASKIKKSSKQLKKENKNKISKPIVNTKKSTKTKKSVKA
ncbi:50S ribosomal protein L1 [Wickerhamomyces ciferrii]|uniref:50S ribosomal protein L1 n=1 Tax=Wickerhamomyces ciferrii (strain ATCC 14091 / BCRC 22168 / CBS 111 / JCM 3599 / NBRC 0793 / NRRL Y-1031 F-60-10) TaxID=1206466 RepID=K0KV32_WICCF|nr:50S ribosomal protein L1 [Wickerhamomyces ciferrii]CCH45264.1 50S ribosomal protein L1 [Wickerhamomyces ciferrii]